jgi:hypothetical protein
MNNSDILLKEMSADLDEFKGYIQELTKNNTETYDSSLKFPTWRASNLEHYAKDFLMTTVRFKVHLEFLAAPNALISDPAINKAALLNIGKQLLQHIETYQNNVTKKNTGERLMKSLNNLGTILNNYSRPDNSAESAPPTPGKR